MPMPLAKIQSTITDLLPFPPILTRDQCEILSELDNIVSNNHLTLKDLDIEPADVEKAMIKADNSRKKRAKQIDSAAATNILQGALDFIQMDKTKKSLDEK